MDFKVNQTGRNMSVTLNGKEVVKQPQRALVATAAITGGLIGAFIAMVVALVILLLGIVLLPFHPLMVLAGRKGFWFHEVQNGKRTLVIGLNSQSFQRR